jgi:type IV secretory pathway VirB10-like protein
MILSVTVIVKLHSCISFLIHDKFFPCFSFNLCFFLVQTTPAESTKAQSEKKAKKEESKDSKQKESPKTSKPSGGAGVSPSPATPPPTAVSAVVEPAVDDKKKKKKKGGNNAAEATATAGDEAEWETVKPCFTACSLLTRTFIRRSIKRRRSS